MSESAPDVPPPPPAPDDAPPASDTQTAPAGPKEFPCRQCGAKVQYDPSAAALKCPYCGHENPVPRSEEDIRELDFFTYLSKAAESEQTITESAVQCGGCGAQTTLAAGLAADECPFCGAAIVAEPAETTVIRPRSLLPFAVDRRQAVEAFRTWVASLWFAPGKLKQYARSDASRLTGVYVPYWTYDADTTSAYTGQRGEDYWDTQRYTTTENGKTVTKTRRVRKTRWYPASGVVFNRFDDVLVLASRSLPKTYADRLEPWDLHNLVAYDDQYLSGFRAERYQVDLGDGFSEARQIMDTHIRESVRRDIGGDRQRIHSVSTQHDNVTFKHLLLPVWISAYKFKDKTYRFLVNARTGVVQGERPWCWWKIALAVLAALAVVAAAVYLFSQYAQGSGGSSPATFDIRVPREVPRLR
jgi:DNA-directed RNA polymerase subunit RPC12/RpoP